MIRLIDWFLWRSLKKKKKTIFSMNWRILFLYLSMHKNISWMVDGEKDHVSFYKFLRRVKNPAKRVSFLIAKYKQIWVVFNFGVLLKGYKNSGYRSILYLLHVFKEQYPYRIFVFWENTSILFYFFNLTCDYF